MPHAHLPDDPAFPSDSLSLSDLHHVALDVLARLLESKDERIALRAAQIVLDRSYRANPAALPIREEVLTFVYENPDGSYELDTGQANWPHPPSARPALGDGS